MDIAALATQLRVKLNRGLVAAGFPRDWFLIPLAAIIGTLAGLAAQGYGQLVRLSETMFYARGHALDANSRWWLVCLFPLLGAALVGLIKVAFRLPLLSHGIPEVMESISRNRGKLPLRAGIFTAVNSAITLGSGGSAGQEGPIVHIGSVIGSGVGQALRVGREHMSTLVGCGAAAGLAAIFHAPIAGVLLVLEVVLRDFSFRTFMPIVIASVLGVTVCQLVGGESAALFSLGPDLLSYHFTLAEVVPYLVLGVVCGLVGVAFTFTLHEVESHWTKFHLPRLVKPVTGAVVLSLLGIAMIAAFPHKITDYRPTFFGNGYPVVEYLLNPTSYGPDLQNRGSQLTLLFLIAVTACKLVGTCFTLGTGGSGGLFAPSLVIGAAAGAAFGVMLQALGVYREVSPAAYALAGMAGVLSGAVHCPLTAIILVFEITHDYSVIMPIMLVAIAATTVAQLLRRNSIYTQALEEMGLRLETISDQAVLRGIEVEEVLLVDAVTVFPGDPAQRLVELAARESASDFVVCDHEQRYLGMVVGEDLRVALLAREALPVMIVADLIRTDLPTLTPDESLDVALDHLGRHDVLSLPVVDAKQKVLGMVTRSRLMQAYQRALAQRA